MAYAEGLARRNLTIEESDLLLAGLGTGRTGVARRYCLGIEPGDEDIHTAVERRLGELTGSVAGKLHTGRSRNDQIATDQRWWLRNQIDDLDCLLAELIDAATERETEIDADAGIHPPAKPGAAHLLVAVAAQPYLGVATGPRASGRPGSPCQPFAAGRRRGRQSLRGGPPLWPRTWVRRQTYSNSIDAARPRLRGGVPSVGAVGVHPANWLRI